MSANHQLVEEETFRLKMDVALAQAFGSFPQEDPAAVLAKDPDPLATVGPEAADAGRAAASLPIAPRSPSWLMFTLGIAALAQLPFVAMWALQARPSIFGSEGTVYIETAPAGVEVWSEGTSLGRTPLQVSLAEGQRLIELRHGSERRSLPVTVTPGAILRQWVEFVDTSSAAIAAVSKSGTLQITTEPPRATVSVDGSARGPSPVTIANLPAGAHVVSVRFASGTVERQIRVDGGSTASLVVTMPPVPNAISGWVAIDVPAPLQILEDGRLVGTTAVDRLMLPVGQHTLEFASNELGFRAQRSVTVNPGRTTTVRLELPRASLSINAQPWADVWVDGEPVGETPIGNLSRPIGLHEVIFRHPSLGERRASVVITLKEPARIGVDLRRGN